MKDIDLKLIRAAFKVANRARMRGNHPFGALLVDSEHNILLEAENNVVTAKDITGHAETNLMRVASNKYSPEFLATCTIYTSTEPCPMCSGAIFWANVRRVVYGLSEERLYQLCCDDPTDAVLLLPCREVFARGQRSIQVVGPVLEEEAERIHHGFWK